MLGAGLACGKARVVGEMGKLWGFTETQPPIVRMGINGNITVLRVEDGIGWDACQWPLRLLPGRTPEFR